MPVLREQFLKSQSVTAVDAVETVVLVDRPTSSPAEPPYAQGTDHVTKSPSLLEHRAGTVALSLGANLVAADVFLRKLEIVQIAGSGSNQSGVPGPGDALFPSGASLDTVTRVEWDSEGADNLATNDAAFDALMDKIHLLAEQQVRLTLQNNSGGDLTDDLRADYAMGRNQAEIA